MLRSGRSGGDIAPRAGRLGQPGRSEEAGVISSVTSSDELRSRISVLRVLFVSSAIIVFSGNWLKLFLVPRPGDASPPRSFSLSVVPPAILSQRARLIWKRA